MIGRYGNDQLNRALLVVGVVSMVLAWIVHWKPFWWLTLLCLVLVWFRLLSRNIFRRQQENRKYLQATAGLRSEFSFQKRKWRERDAYLYFKCPHCHAHLRVPRGKGRVMVRCNKCGQEFQKIS